MRKQKKNALVWLGYSLLGLGWAYELYVYLQRPSGRPPKSTLLPRVADAVTAMALLYVTGGVHSPFFVALYLPVVALAFRSTYREPLVAAGLYAGGYVLLAFATGELFSAWMAVAARTSGFVLTAAFGAAVARAVLAQVTTRSKLMERLKAVAEAERRFRTLAESAFDAVLITGDDGLIEYINPAAEQMFDRNGLEVRKLPLAELIPAWSGGRHVPGPLGTPWPRLTNLWGKRRDGSSFRIELSMAQWSDESGPRFVAIVRDISSVEVAEEQRELALARLMIAERMSSPDALAARVGVELTDPISYLQVNLSYLADELPKLNGEGMPELFEALSGAQDGASRIDAMVRQLKALARPEQPTPVALRAVMEASIGSVRDDLCQRARLVKVLNPVPQVNADAGRLGEVVTQLLVNAARSIPEGASDRHEIRVITRTDANGCAVAEVIDTAPAIPPHSLGQLFEPFCTRQVRPGAGLDLFLCQRIIRGMGGTLEVDSTRGLGNVFRIVLPAAAADGGTEAIPAPAVRARPASRRSESVRKRMGGGLR